jgi:hypothetical protein
VIEWLQKPIGLDELGQVLQRALRPAQDESARRRASRSHQ